MDTQRYTIGQFAISRAGRDKGRLFIIVETVDERFVKVADGDLRRIDKPKLKKVMHLNPVRYVDEELAAILVSKGHITDAMIRKCIEKYNTQG